ncbi:MAG: hypothetical protein KY464_04485, partial [Gemmatimonadetes bacterium]|nr:hypothetical protein [Gemmatimonadota bacterium]
PAPEPEPEEEAAAGGSGRSDALFSRLRRRVRGRVLDELRDRNNLAAARTEDSILETHVENALVFRKALADELSAPEAVEMYLETMMLPEGVSDVIYNRSLRVLADQVLPPIPNDSATPAGSEAVVAASVEVPRA